MQARLYPVFGIFLMLLGVSLWFMTELHLGSNVMPGPVVTLNISSLGMAEFIDVNSTLHANISALLPGNSSASDHASITKYLGVPDWYAIYLRGYCSGYYYTYDWPVRFLDGVYDVEADGNCTAYSGVQSYRFDLHGILDNALPEGVKNLAHPYLNFVVLNVATWQLWWWYVGGALWPLVVVSQYLTIWGTRRINGIVVMLTLALFASLMTSTSYMLSDLQRLPLADWVSVTYIQYHLSIYLFLLVVVFSCCEWKLQRWTHPLFNIEINHKPDGVSWWSLHPPPNTYVTDPEILLRPMNDNFDPRRQRRGVRRAGRTGTQRTMDWIGANGYGEGQLEDFVSPFPRARRDDNQGQAS